MRTIAGHLIELISKQGIKHIFGVPSGELLPYMEAMENSDVEFVLVANEGSAGFMAAVYGWLRGVPGVCYGTFGPGATNLSTGVGTALLDRAPVIALTSESSDAMLGRTTQMAIDHQALFGPLTKWSVRLKPTDINDTFTKAVKIATEEIPGPVHIGLPSGIGDLLAPESFPTAPIPSKILPPDEKLLTSMEQAVTSADRPIIAVGLTAHRMGLGPQILEIAEKHEIPIVITPMTKGLIPEDHPSYAGVLMHALSDMVAETHCQADLVIGIGYDPVEFNYEEWMPSVNLVHIDTVAADIDGSLYPEVINVTGVLETALERLTDLEPIDSKWDLSLLGDRRTRMFEKLKPQGTTFGPLAVLEILREVLPEDGIMACDVGSHTHLIGQAWRTPHPYGQIMTNGWSSMGFGVPAAIAAKIARPEVEVACVTGDGGFMMMAGEMATARRLGLKLVFILLADRSLELIRLKQMKRGKVSDATVLSDLDVPASDNIFGVPVLPATDRESFREKLIEAFSTDGPTIIEAFINPSEYKDLILRTHK